jgi:hypothetical protein
MVLKGVAFEKRASALVIHANHWPGSGRIPLRRAGIGLYSMRNSPSARIRDFVHVLRGLVDYPARRDAIVMMSSVVALCGISACSGSAAGLDIIGRPSRCS